MHRKRSKFSFYSRGFTTFLLTGALLLIAVTGAVLFAAPQGRVAHWTGWTVFGLGKDQWGAIHVTTAALFVLAAGVHLFFNWKVLLGYIRLKRIAGLRLKRELAASVAVSVFVVVGTLGQIPPFSTIVDLHNEIKRSWDRAGTRAPVPHAEELALDELAEQMGLPVEQVVRTLEDEGLEEASAGLPVARIARANGVAPNRVYEAIRSRHASTDSHPLESDGPRLGLGKMTLGEFCAAESLSYAHVMTLLRRRGVQANEASTLRELAASLEVRPGELASTLGQRPTSSPEALSCSSSGESRAHAQ